MNPLCCPQLYCAPGDADAVLVIDPVLNTTDITTMNGLGGSASYKWSGITFCPMTNKVRVLGLRWPFATDLTRVMSDNERVAKTV